MKRFWTLVVTTLGILLLLITMAVPVAAEECPPTPCPNGFEGLTPGFWKNHTSAWHDYDSGQKLSTVFNVPLSFGLADYSLLEALKFGGGPGDAGMARNLLRQAVAALLNAADPDINYPVSIDDIILWTNGSLAADRGTMEIQKNWWDQFNNLGLQ